MNVKVLTYSTHKNMQTTNDATEGDADWIDEIISTAIIIPTATLKDALAISIFRLFRVQSSRKSQGKRVN